MKKYNIAKFNNFEEFKESVEREFPEKKDVLFPMTCKYCDQPCDSENNVCANCSTSGREYYEEEV